MTRYLSPLGQVLVGYLALAGVLVTLSALSFGLRATFLAFALLHLGSLLAVTAAWLRKDQQWSAAAFGERSLSDAPARPPMRTAL